MSGHTVLYVEDEPDDVLFMQRAFQKSAAQCHLRSVRDGREAITYLAGAPPFADRAAHPFPDMLLLDLNLPVISGFEVLAWIRKHPRYQQLPVVIFSSSGRVEDRKRAEACGANAYIMKPTSGVQFLQVAERLRNEWLSTPPRRQPVPAGRPDLPPP